MLAAMEPRAGAETSVVRSGGEHLSLPLAEVLADNDLRLFTVIGEADVTFALARMEGEVIVPDAQHIEPR